MCGVLEYSARTALEKDMRFELFISEVQADATREAFEAGQEVMRERAASPIAHPQCDFTEPQDAADAIRALPIEEPAAS